MNSLGTIAARLHAESPAGVVLVAKGVRRSENLGRLSSAAGAYTLLFLTPLVSPPSAPPLAKMLHTMFAASRTATRVGMRPNAFRGAVRFNSTASG